MFYICAARFTVTENLDHSAKMIQDMPSMKSQS